MRLIFDSGKMWSFTFFKNKNLKKGGGKGGADSYIWDAVMIMSKNAKMTSETLIRVSYYGIFGRNQHSERLPPPFAPPFIFIPIEWKNQNFPLFRGRTQYSWVPRWRCPPFLPPFLNFWKVQNIIYKFCMYHFSSKCVVFALETQVLKTN